MTPERKGWVAFILLAIALLFATPSYATTLSFSFSGAEVWAPATCKGHSRTSVTARV